MFEAGASDDVTVYVQAEVDYAREDYYAAEAGFAYVLDSTADVKLQKRTLRSLAEVYRECAELAPAGGSPVDAPAEKEVQLLEDGIRRYGLEYDTSMWEMLGEAYYEAAHVDSPVNTAYLEEALHCFNQMWLLGMRKEYIFTNMYTIYCELGDYDSAHLWMGTYSQEYPDDYTPYALRAMATIAMENQKPQEYRNYSGALKDFERAEERLRSDDDATYFQQLESLIDQLKEHGWL